jgi:hypothetical protein
VGGAEARGQVALDFDQQVPASIVSRGLHCLDIRVYGHYRGHFYG